MAASNVAGNAAAKVGEREIVATRLFDAPRELVFKLWTDREHIGNWWGPKGFSLTIQEMDVRPGGAWRFIMHGPDGRDYDNQFLYQEIAAPERIVMRHQSAPEFEMRVTFAERDNQTEVGVRMVFASAKLRDGVAREFGAVEGLTQTLNRFEKLVAGVRNVAAKPKQVALTRVFDAPRELVFQAWTDPKHLAKWFGPKVFTNPVCELDVRPGGAIYLVMRSPDGAEFPMKGVFREVVPPEKLVFTSTALHDADGDPGLENLNTVTFEEYDGKTKLTLKAVVLRAAESAALALEGMEAGWSQSLDKLADLLATISA